MSSPTLSPDSLTALAAASAAINSTLDSPTVLDQIARSAAEVMQAEASSVLTLDRRRGKLIFAAAVGEHGDRLLGKQLDAELGIAGHVIRSGRPENVTDVKSNSEFFRGFDEHLAFQTRGMMAAPMIYKSEVIGVVEVINRRDGRPFSEEDLHLVELFANLAACAARNARTHENLKRERNALRNAVFEDNEIVGASPRLKETMQLADRVAPTNATVLLTGETGTGKEVLAKYIHTRSQRADKPFVAVNCAALPETLLESELFGHEKGAFTGAINQRQGRFELADEGTLFLDEIGDIPASMQVRLLRLLQERAFTRVGGTQTIFCDVRIIAATNRDLKKGIQEGRFRDDLYYRLNVFPIPMPPLRERKGDVPALAEHFIYHAAADLGVPRRSASKEFSDALVAYPWPGNIRELANVIERAVLLCNGPELLPSHLPREITHAEPSTVAASTLPGAERDMIVRTLNETHWNQSKAARLLGISRDNLRYRLKKYNIQRDGA